MDSDNDSVDDWVVLASSSTSDDDRVIALSSGCITPNANANANASDSEPDHATGSPSPSSPNTLLLAFAAAFAAAAADDDAEGVYTLSDAEDTDASPPPSPPLPKPLSGLFHHTLDGGVSYAAFDPAPVPATGAPSGSAAHRGAKQLVPDPTFAAFFDEPVSALASTRGLVCLRGASTGRYYVANPATFAREPLPLPARDHFKHGDPAVVIAFGLDPCDADDEASDDASFYRDYHVVVAFPVDGGIYAFESFSSAAWTWAIGNGIAAAEIVLPCSGVGALGCAFWRTSMGQILCYEPVSRSSDLVSAPHEVMQWPYWELGEMDGTLCATCMDNRVHDVFVLRLDFVRRATNADISKALSGFFEGGSLRGRHRVTLLRSQGKAEVVMWDPSAETVVAMDLEGRTTRTISFMPGSAYYADFIPYVSSMAAISGSGKRAKAARWTSATNKNVGADDYKASMSVDAEAYQISGNS